MTVTTVPLPHFRSCHAGAERRREMSAPAVARSPWVVLISTSLAVFAVFLDTTILFVAFPSISADFADVSATSLSWVLNAYTIVFAALLIPAGRLADRVGRRRTFLVAVVVFTVASMLCGLAPNAGLLVVARIGQAVGAAALVPASLALVLQTFPRHKIPVAVAVWGAVGAVAGAAGPTLGAFVVEHLGWRWAFFINLPVGIVSLMLGRRVLPEGRESNPGRLPDPAGVVLLAAGLALDGVRHRADRRVGLGERALPRHADGGAGARRRLRLALQSGAEPARGPVAVPSSQLPLGQCRHGRVRHRLQRDVPRQRAVPHEGVGVLDHGGGTRDLGRPDGRGGDGAVLRPARRTDRTTPSPHPRRARLGGGRCVPAGVRHHDPGLRRHLSPCRPVDRARRRALPAAALVGRRARVCRPTGSARARRSTRRSATSVPRSASPSSLRSPRRWPPTSCSTASTRSGGCWWRAASASRCWPPGSHAPARRPGPRCQQRPSPVSPADAIA